jgi:Fur family zinc uptake transcriptional regulator
MEQKSIMANLQSIIDHAERHCQQHGTRLTDKRKLILSGLLKSNQAMSAYELIDYCKEEFGETLPAMSVYRMLEFLQEEQLVHKLNLANKFVACSHITCGHEHVTPQFLICGACQKVQEIGIDTNVLKKLEKNVSDAKFRLLSPQLEMSCICADCDAPKDKN